MDSPRSFTSRLPPSAHTSRKAPGRMERSDDKGKVRITLFLWLQILAFSLLATSQHWSIQGKVRRFSKPLRWYFLILLDRFQVLREKYEQVNSVCTHES